MTNMSIQPLWLTHFIETLLFLEFQLTKFIVGVFSYKAHFRPQISSNALILQMRPWCRYKCIKVISIRCKYLSDLDGSTDETNGLTKKALIHGKRIISFELSYGHYHQCFEKIITREMTLNIIKWEHICLIETTLNIIKCD